MRYDDAKSLDKLLTLLMNGEQPNERMLNNCYAIIQHELGIHRNRASINRETVSIVKRYEKGTERENALKSAKEERMLEKYPHLRMLKEARERNARGE